MTDFRRSLLVYCVSALLGFCGCVSNQSAIPSLRHDTLEACAAFREMNYLDRRQVGLGLLDVFDEMLRKQQKAKEPGTLRTRDIVQLMGEADYRLDDGSELKYILHRDGMTTWHLIFKFRDDYLSAVHYGPVTH